MCLLVSWQNSFEKQDMTRSCIAAKFGQEGQDGYNIAVFELEDAEILNCAPYRVESIEVNFKEFGNRWFAGHASSQDDETVETPS